ncbi:hypothetical protein F5Y09DRAFT_356788 [Xylaria sp. FL1042]|nr:hypothetical protein F5Y09DRAFT_356788 [Xylaria sp. FL1042]
MFLKFYIFIRDFMPRGLVDNLAYIKGQDVMDHLLCHAEHTPSRHRVSKAADVAFTELEQWMGSYSNWRSSIQQSGADAEKSRHRKKGDRKQRKLPGLHSPAGLLALLVIAHPDPDSRFKNWIGRLQIDWMMQPRDTLDVKDGFWKGLNANNVYKIFSVEEKRIAEILPLVDYTPLFQHFEMARKDIRPYVKEWEHRISLREAANTAYMDEPIGHTDGSAQEAAEIGILKSHFYPEISTEAAELKVKLEAWLLDKLADC